VGQRVDQGQLIGTVGSSGGSSGPHLHFEERKGSKVVPPFFDGVAYKMPQTSASRNCAYVPVAGDWNDNGKDDLGVFERRWSGWFQQKVGASAVRTRMGRGVDSPLVGDWNGDGKTDLGFRRTLHGNFVLRHTGGTTDRSIKMGGRNDIGIAGDWNGDGTTEVGIWRPRTGEFQLRMGNGTIRTFALGSASSLPVTGYFNGDRRTDIGVFDPGTATWHLRAIGRDGWAWSATVKAGNPGELPAPGDFNGDGETDLATWNRSTGAWTMRQVVSGTPRTTVKYFGKQP
jgi:hypothetical protein